MSLRDQPYLPLYVDRFSADEDLRYCSASATGVHIRAMCLFHKSKSGLYGSISLLHEFALGFGIPNGQANGEHDGKPTPQQLAKQFAKQFPYTEEVILSGLNELLEHNVYFFNGLDLCQAGMIKQGQISDKRKDSGMKGVKKRQENQKKKKNFGIPNGQQVGEAKDEAKYITTTTITNTSKKEEDSIGGKGEKEGEEIENLDAQIENYVREMTYEVGEFMEVYFKSQKYSFVREQLAMANYMDEGMLKEWAKAFNLYLITSGTNLSDSGKTVKQESDWSKHFKFWLQDQDKNKNPKELHTKSNNKNGKSTYQNGTKNHNEDYKRELLAKMAERRG